MVIMRAGRGTDSGDPDRARGGLAGWFWLPVTFALLLGCMSGEKRRHYDSAEEATAAEDWPRAAELWFEVHRAEDPRTERTYRETARALYESGDAASACALLEQGIAEFPGEVELPEFRAALLERLGYHRAAEAAYAHLLTIDPDHQAALCALGRLRLKLGLERAAEGPLQRALELYGDDAATHACLGRVYDASGRPELAFLSYGRAIELGCADAEILLDASMLAMRDDLCTRFPEARLRALGWLDALCELDPQCTSAHYLRGIYLAALERPDEAVTALRRAVETDPACREALEQLARLYVDLGDHPRAEEMVERALEIERDPARRVALMALVARD